jgi:Pyruvate/2-oxoacid:ferredoxin oxidoreductase delta subunit
MRIEDDVAVCEVEECMGCGICAQLCPQNAIQMKKQ